MSLYPFAAPAAALSADAEQIVRAVLSPDHPSLPAETDPPCECGEELLQHNDTKEPEPDGSFAWQIGAGPCQHCPYAGYRPSGVDDIAVRAEVS